MTSAAPGASDSPGGSHRWRLRINILLGLATVALGLWAGLQWSLITTEVDTRIAKGSWAEEGPDFSVLKLDDGRILTIDTPLMDRMGGEEAVGGQHLRSSTGERVAHLGDRQIPLWISGTAWRTIALLAAIVVLGMVRHLRVTRLRRDVPATPPVTGPE
jgi:hypothetical protein